MIQLLKHAIVPIVLLSGCASVFEGSSQTILVKPVQGKSANCIVSNDRGKWHVRAPGYVTVMRSSSDLVIQCDDAARKLKAGIEPAAINNIIFGFASLIGIGVDAWTGALHTYASQIESKYETSTASDTPKPMETQKKIIAKAQPTEFYEPLAVFGEPELKLFVRGNKIYLNYVDSKR